MNLIKKIFSSYLLISVLFLGLIFRLISINQSFWLDETTTGYVARDYNVSSTVNEFAPGDFHPPLFYAVENLWSKVFGTSEVSLRFPSIIFGLLTIMVVFMIVGEISEEVFPKFAASILLASSGLHIYYSQEARMYAMSAFLISALIYIFIKTLKDNSGLYFTFFSILLVLNFLTDYLPNLIILVFWCYALLKERDKKWWLRFIIAHLLLLAIFVLWLPYLKSQLSIGLAVKESSPDWWNVLGRANFKELLLVPAKFILGRISFSNKLFYGAIVSIVGVLYGGIMIKEVLSKRKNAFNLLIWFWLIVPILIAFLLSFEVALFSYFRLVFILPAFYILASLGFSLEKNRLKIPIFVIFILVNLISSGIYLFSPQFHRENWKGAVNYIEENLEPSTIILFPSATGTEALRYYASDINYSVITLPSGYNNVWLMRYAQPIFDREDLVRINLENNGYQKISEHDFNGVIVWKYNLNKNY